MRTNNHQEVYSHFRKAKINHIERKDPLQKIVGLLNQFWSIDLMEATDEEKIWAKTRLEKRVKGLSNHISKDIKPDILMSMRYKNTWERVRNTIG